MATISTSGISAGQIIRAEHLLRVINALDGTSPNNIIITAPTTISGSLALTGSLSVSGSAIVRGLTTTAQTNVVTYNASTGQFFYTASSALALTGSGGGGAGGSDTQIQFNSGSNLGGNSAFKFIYNSSSVILGTGLSSGLYALAQGFNVIASANFSTAIGSNTRATNLGAHAEGTNTQASGQYSHAEGRLTSSSGDYSHAEGNQTAASGSYSHAEGWLTKATGDYSHTEGYQPTALGFASHAEGYNTTSSGQYSHAEGANTISLGSAAHAEGQGTLASGDYSHAEGWATSTIGEGSHAEGYSTYTSGLYSHTEGLSTITTGPYSHAEGNSSETYGPYSHAEGYTYDPGGGGEIIPTRAEGTGSHAEGRATYAIGEGSHAEGDQTYSSGSWSHAEGYSTITLGQYAHAEGYQTRASGESSHAEGRLTTSSANYSHAEGFNTVASGQYQHVQGQYNISSSAQSAFIIGNGTSNANRSNLVFASGSIFQITGSLRVSGSITGSLFGTASHVLNQLVTSSLIDSYIGTRIFPTSTTSNGFAVDTNVNGAVGLVIRNSDTGGNAAYSAVSLATSGSWYNTGSAFIYFNSGYYVTSLRDTGGIFSGTNSNILLINNKDFAVQTGATISTLSTKFKVSGSGNVYIPSGNLEVSGSITGSLFGTASWANNATTASYASNFNYNNIITGSVNYIPYYSSSNSFGNSVLSQTISTIGINTTTFLNGSTMFSVSRPAQQSQIDFIPGNPGSANSGIYSNNTLDIATKGDIILYAGTSSIINNNPEILRITGSTGNIGIRTTTPQYTLDVSGSLRVTNGITGSLFGTASWALNSISSSYPLTITGSTLRSTYVPGGAGASTVGSIFIGDQAGDQATGANSSNFIGYAAGRSAGGSYSSNFIGPNAGDIATDARYSNFMGANAGYSATNADNSNFLGLNAGYQATNANNSNFLGTNAGFQATNANYSNFFGQQAGYQSINASVSNFLGQQAGYQATNADQSNFFGYQAGRSATNAYISNFIGVNAGTNAVSASYSTLLGKNAGSTPTGTGSIGSNNIIIGTNITLAPQQKDSINLGGIIFATGSYSTVVGNPFSGSVTGAKVGIGTSTPAYTLDVSGSTRINDILILEPRSTTPGSPTNGMLIVSGSGANQHIYCYLNSTWKQLD
jgi:hypothetical protein